MGTTNRLRRIWDRISRSPDFWGYVSFDRVQMASFFHFELRIGRFQAGAVCSRYHPAKSCISFELIFVVSYIATYHFTSCSDG
ncbi:hypothetical protein BP00DRAFT_61651 [Aspergillus indologenus CBS 114.80]|uniref:Uncharacterized protein n=1 Tax=Aspergillus indologenus CBS 114.80 TaxID=1450541 RepID=A0A2V5HPS5_9EURO|nr:hypothetical protein BP00DRAFT_61651 [Aspergillus indologenus CBS 114.80]